MKIVLISTYELGRQPFGLASPAAWLRELGADVECFDVSRETLAEDVVRTTDLIAFYVPMHTATRLAVALLPVVREMNPRAHTCFYGLYAPVNEGYLRTMGADTILGGEFEEGLAKLATELALVSSRTEPKTPPPALRLSSNETGLTSELKLRPPKNLSTTGSWATPNTRPPLTRDETVISLARQKFRVPDRRGFVPLEKYARLMMPDGESRIVGYTEASRGCKHLCRHCPVVPVYNGVFRIVERDVVLADIRQQVNAGAQHITFGDPDFFNGVGHAIPLVEALHRDFPQLTYDVTIKIEHLLKHDDCLPKLRDTGCLFVTSAVESVDDHVLQRLAKNHTRADFLRVVARFRQIGLTLAPTFVTFTPWTTLEGYCELLEILREQELIENVAPIQLAIRLLIPAGSRLLELEEVREMVEPFDEAGLVYPWKHKDPRVDALCERLQEIVHAGEKMGRSRGRIFERIEEAAYQALGPDEMERTSRAAMPILVSRSTIPYLNEPWYC